MGSLARTLKRTRAKTQCDKHGHGWNYFQNTRTSRTFKICRVCEKQKRLNTYMKNFESEPE